jgi:hypothetical protein
MGPASMFPFWSYDAIIKAAVQVCCSATGGGIYHLAGVQWKVGMAFRRPLGVWTGCEWHEVME